MPIAVEVLKQIEAGKMAFDQTIVFDPSMRRDGSGETSFQKIGTRLTIRYLLEQTLVKSDNASSDMLIEWVGLNHINETLRKLVPREFSPITTLLDVRRLAYSELHPKAVRLDGNNYIDIKSKKDYRKRYEHFAKLVQVPVSKLRQPNLESAFAAYYAKGYNSGTLRGYADLLELLAEKKAVSPFVSEEVFKIMSRCKTGKARLKAHFPTEFKFAHKTGTQIQRICDFGILTVPSGATFSVGACAENFTSFKKAEEALAAAGKAIAREIPR